MMLKQIIAVVSAISLTIAAPAVFADADPGPIKLAADAPDRYVVVPGDTLWGISGKFLKEPWRWPEIWQMNKDQIKNPHRIYPGDVVLLERDAAGNPRLRLAGSGAANSDPGRIGPKVYSESLSNVIPSIPARVIEPFLSEPLIIEMDGLDEAPRIVATEEDRVNLGTGNKAYVSGVVEKASIWQVYRPGKVLKDPVNDEYLGREAIYLGTARSLEAGDPAVFEISSSKLEISRGDRLIPVHRPEPIAYAPHAPNSPIEGHVISIYGGTDERVSEAGKYSIVALSKGRRDGLDVGTILALYRNRQVRTLDDDGKASSLKLPDERYGLVFVFRTFDRVSYALVATSTRSVVSGDIVRNP